MQREEMGHADKISQKRFTTIGLDPQDVLIVFAIAIGVLHRYLRFADASQTTQGQRLRDGCRFLLGEQTMQVLEDLLTSRKVRIAWELDIPQGLLLTAWDAFSLYSFFRGKQVVNDSPDALYYLKPCLVTVEPLAHGLAITG